MNIAKEIGLWLGVGRNTTSHSEKLLSALGACLGICAVLLASHWAKSGGFIDSSTSSFIVASMGASAVLLFAVPHGALSQPWALVGGHLVSAFIGVSCAKLITHEVWGAGLAVGLSVGAMYYLRCIHPPGGATALTAVLGGVAVDDLGYGFLVVPVTLNLLGILVVALVFNGSFAWRRYPAHWGRLRKSTTSGMSTPLDRQIELTQEDFAAAMHELDSYVDITTEGLTDLLELAKQHAEKNVMHPENIVAGKYYSNGKLGQRWSIRQVVDAESHPIAAKEQVIYKILAGEGAYDTGICLRDEFRQWARFEVLQLNGRWVKLSED